jgi:hypothetical protein
VKRLPQRGEVIVVCPATKLEHIRREHVSVLADLENPLQGVERKALGNDSFLDRLRRLDHESMGHRFPEGHLDDAADLDAGQKGRRELVGEKPVKRPRNGN